MDRDLLGCLNTKADPIPSNIQNRYFDIVRNDDLLAFSAGNDKHYGYQCRGGSPSAATPSGVLIHVDPSIFSHTREHAHKANVRKKSLMLESFRVFRLYGNRGRCLSWKQ